MRERYFQKYQHGNGYCHVKCTLIPFERARFLCIFFAICILVILDVHSMDIQIQV